MQICYFIFISVQNPTLPSGFSIWEWKIMNHTNVFKSSVGGPNLIQIVSSLDHWNFFKSTIIKWGCIPPKKICNNSYNHLEDDNQTTKMTPNHSNYNSNNQIHYLLRSFICCWHLFLGATSFIQRSFNLHVTFNNYELLNLWDSSFVTFEIFQFMNFLKPLFGCSPYQEL
jgi:hypothetical protein